MSYVNLIINFIVNKDLKFVNNDLKIELERKYVLKMGFY